MEPTMRTDIRILIFDLGLAIQQFFRGARIRCDVIGQKQSRDDHDPARASSDHFRQIVQLDAADAKIGMRTAS